MIVCASNEAPTLQETIKWKGVIQENSEGVGEGDIPCLLVQNKSDLITPDAPEPHQTQKYLDEFAKANGFFGAMQCSAKENKNVEEIFQTLLGKPAITQTRSTSEEESAKSQRLTQQKTQQRLC